jgi:hypothetical protein
VVKGKEKKRKEKKIRATSPFLPDGKGVPLLQFYTRSQHAVQQISAQDPAQNHGILPHIPDCLA